MKVPLAPVAAPDPKVIEAVTFLVMPMSPVCVRVSLPDASLSYFRPALVRVPRLGAP